MKSDLKFTIGLLLAGWFIFAGAKAMGEGYYLLVAFYIAQYMVLSTAWNILGGYGGYVNFGSAGFFAIGAYSTVFFYKWLGLQRLKTFSFMALEWDPSMQLYLILPAAIALGALFAGLVGWATGYLTLRLRGVYFAISTLALSVVVMTLVLNWSFVGGARGAYIIKPAQAAGFANSGEMVFAAMLCVTLGAIWLARRIEHSPLGAGLEAIRDDEDAAECSGVPTLRLKLQATTISGAMMGSAGALFPFFVTYVDPIGAFNLVHTVNSIAMPLIGGMTHWSGPLLGALLLGGVQQYFGSKNIITPELSLLFVGLLMMIFVAVAPNGLLGLWQRWRNKVRT
jgi:branched-chain amino acid transport system permease protein